MSGTSLQATWRKIAEHDALKRSSHAVAAIDGEVFLFGGEVVARVPRDGDVHSLAVQKGTVAHTAKAAYTTNDFQS